MSDRRRINGPAGGTTAPVYSKYLVKEQAQHEARPRRTRAPNVLRKIPASPPSASGSAYLELESSKPPRTSPTAGLASLSTSGLKLTCTVHGPRPLPKSAPFSPHIILTTHVKYAPFATRKRRGYLRDSTERDLGVHLEMALRGVIIGDRWPKSGVEVIITILEGEEDHWVGSGSSSSGGSGAAGMLASGEWGMMSVLCGCITVASAAIADAGIDCVDSVSGGVAAVVRSSAATGSESTTTLVLDPVPSEHEEILAAGVVAYLPNRDEITDLWVKGDIGHGSQTDKSQSASYEELADNAVQAALGSNRVLVAALKETADVKLGRS